MLRVALGVFEKPLRFSRCKLLILQLWISHSEHSTNAYLFNTRHTAHKGSRSPLPTSLPLYLIVND